MKEVDVCVVGAHPDDIEMCAGGLVLTSIEAGHRVGGIDLTRGEMGSLGTAETRAQETEAATALMGLTDRVNLDLGDSRLEANEAQSLKLAQEIRDSKCRLLVANYWESFHPDHVACSQLCDRANWLAGLRNHPDLKGEAHRAKRIVYYMDRIEAEPHFVLNIDSVWEKKLEVVASYKSQFVQGSPEGRLTDIGQVGFMEGWTARARHYGRQAGCQYGEPYVLRHSIPTTDVLGLLHI